MTKKTRKPAQTPRPESQKPPGSRADKAGDPGDLFYARNRGRNSRKRFARARKLQGLNHEITVLRVRLRNLIVTDPNNHTRIAKTFDLLIRAYAAKIRSSGDSQDPDGKAIENMLREAADTLGLDTIPWNEKRMINPMNIFNRKPRPVALPVIRPESTFDAVLEMRLAELQQQVAEVKGRINILFFFVMVAAMLQFVFGIAGVTPW